MAYEVRYTDQANKGVIVVEDNTINNDTSIQIPGRFSSAYGQVVGESFLHLLENFASANAPARPVEGQLWYDTSEGVDQLKIYDGTNWLSASGLKKGTTEPVASNSNAGDLWVDTDNQQLYLYSGSQWVLVGPSFSDGLLTGATPVTLIGQDNLEYTVLKIDIRDVTVAIISDNNFNLKSTIAGFTSGIKKGINLSNLNDAYVLAGVAEETKAIRVTNDPNTGVATVSANDLLRGDAPSTTNFRLRIKNNNGLTVGTGDQLSFTVAGEAGIITHNTAGSNIDIRVKDGDQTKTVMRIDSTTNIGINNLAPEEALDIIGNLKISPSSDDNSKGRIIVTNTNNSVDFTEGSITTLGGIGVSKNVSIGGDLIVNGVSEFGNVIPDANGSRNIGTANLRFDQIYANTFFGNITGNVTGTVSGRASSADRLTSSTSFRMQGDVSAASFEFDGKAGESTKTFVTTISDSFISTKPTLFVSSLTDELIVNKTTGDNQGLYKISKLNFLASVPIIPVGTILPYGGDSEPSGWLFCDGREILKTQFSALFNIIGYNFRDPALLSDNGINFFALPDMRGRFPLGVDNMGEQPAAGRVTSSGATAVGNNLGTEKVTIDIANLPEHEHDLRGASGQQYYVVRDNPGVPLDSEAIQYDAPTGTLAGQALPSSGGIKTSTTLGQPLDVMNPYLAVNYIIYTGT